MTIRTQNTGTAFRLRPNSAAQLVILCLCALALWGCAKPSEPKDKPAADTPPVTQDPSTPKAFEILFSSPDKDGKFVTANAFDITEGDTPVTVKLTFSEPSPRELKFSYSVSGAAKQETQDLIYTPPPEEFGSRGAPIWSLTIAKGATEATVTPVILNDDKFYEGTESLTVTFALLGAGTRSVEFTIKDNDPPPSVKLELRPQAGSSDRSEISEGAGTVTIHASLIDPRSGFATSSPFPVRIPLRFSGIAEVDLDYRNPGRFTPEATSGEPDGCHLLADAAHPSVLVIPPNTETIDFALLVNEDFAAEGSGTETAIITAKTPSILGPTIECGSLVDSDNKAIAERPLTLVIKDSSVNGQLNPTGVTTCVTADKVNVACNETGDFPNNQDGLTGSAASSLVAETDTGTGTNCVRDTNAKLMWEYKTKPADNKDPDKRDVNHAYAWLDKRSNVNGGDEGGVGGENPCGKSLSACNTSAYIEKINSENYCGHSDWRLPTVKELLSLVRHGVPGSAVVARINTDFFPNTRVGPYWTSTPTALYPDLAWVVDFSNGRIYTASKDESAGQSYYVRLVRSDQ